MSRKKRDGVERVEFTLNKDTDPEVIEYLKTVKNQAGLMKKLLREHVLIQKVGAASEPSPKVTETASETNEAPIKEESSTEKVKKVSPFRKNVISGSDLGE